MARLKDTVIPLGDYPTGTHSFGPFTISNQAVKVGIELARCTTADPTIWPNENTTGNLSAEVSFDNGATWQFAAGCGISGGIRVDKTGNDAPFTGFTIPLPPGNNRRIRVTVVIENGPLRTYGNLIVVTA